jgi:membrane protein YqaA with SNARE-associated domain
MKHIVDQIGIYIHENFERLCGATVGIGAGVKHVVTQEQEINLETILQKVLLVALYAIVGGIFGGIGKWAIDEFKAYIKKYKNEQKRKS